MSLLNFILYFVMSRSGRYNPKEIKRKQQFRSQVTQTVREAKQNGRHRCAVCGRTDLDDPELVFRFCSKCEGDYEYCQDHLYTHKHVTKAEWIRGRRHHRRQSARMKKQRSFVPWDRTAMTGRS